MHKILRSISLEIMKLIFNTLESLILSKRNVKTVRNRLQTMSYMGPKIWDLLNKKMKQVSPLNEFYAKIKIWKLEKCPYRLSRICLPQIGLMSLLTQTNAVQLRARGTLSGNPSAAVICIRIK